MVAAGVALFVGVVGALGQGIVHQQPGGQVLRRLVRVPGHPGVELDARLGQGGFGTAPNAAAHQGLHPLGLEEPGQGPVAAAVGVHHLGGDHLAPLQLVELELGGVAEVLEDLSVFVGNGRFHNVALLCVVSV